jgi:hypothetical protein
LIILILLKEKLINTGSKIIMLVEWGITRQAEGRNAFKPTAVRRKTAETSSARIALPDPRVAGTMTRSLYLDFLD